jgi:hypothetical protein
MAANIKIVKNSKMNRFQWKWIWQPFWFAMVAILNQKCTLVTMGTAAILNFFNPPPKKAATHYGGYSHKVS